MFKKSSNSSAKKLSKTRIVIFVLEMSLIIFLLIFWLSSDSIQKSKNLWVLFLYNFPSQFLIAVVPHEPVHLYFSKFYSSLTVTLISITGTLLTELLNYSTFKFVVDFKSFDKIKYTGFVKKMINIFNKAPFLAIWVAGFTPIPFYPFRFLVVLAHYPVYRYILAVFLSRTPRFYLLALFGQAFKIPDSLLIIFFIILIVIANASILRRIVKNKRKSSYPIKVITIKTSSKKVPSLD